MMSQNIGSGVAPVAVPASAQIARETILFVDDEANILTSLRRMLRRAPYTCFFATSGAEGLEILAREPIDLVVSDMRMPVMDGAQFLSQVRQHWPGTVRMLLTGHSDMGSTIDALNRGGIYRYISKPWDDEELLGVLEDGVRIRRLEREKAELMALTQRQNEQLRSFNEELERRVVARTAELKQTADMLDLAYQQMQGSYEGFVRVFSSVISSRSHLAGSQPQRVADLARSLGTILRLPEPEIRNIYYAALLMDLGKLSLPDDILERAEARLTKADLPAYRKYPLLGEMTLAAIAELAPAAQLIRHHTEYLDGSGYPDGLRGNAIPRGARIIRVARDFVALQTGLISGQRLLCAEAYLAIKAGAGKKYDPHVVKTLEPLADAFVVDNTLPHECKIDVCKLKSGMVVARDILNPNGILLIAKGFILTPGIIEKLLFFEQMDKQKLIVFILREEKPDA